MTKQGSWLTIAQIQPQDIKRLIVTDEFYMQCALELARRAANAGEVPVGAVLTCDNKIIGEGWNQSISTHDPTAHAEVVCLRAAAQYIQNYRLLETTMYVTLEPCAMCAGALVHARVKRLVIAAKDLKTGACGSVMNVTDHPKCNHHVTVETGLLESVSRELLQGFFRSKR